jgi:hypothetical protein
MFYQDERQRIAIKRLTSIRISIAWIRATMASRPREFVPQNPTANRPSRRRVSRALDVKLEQQHVAVLDGVVFAFHTIETLFPCGDYTAAVIFLFGLWCE